MFSFWFYADNQQRSNERLFVFPQTRSSSYHGVESTFRPDCMKLFKNNRNSGCVVFSKQGPVPYTVLKNLFFLMLCSHFKNIQVDGWAALPNIPCHGPVHFTAVLNIFLFWCYADIQQRSNERLVVLAQTRSSSFYRVESTFLPDGVKLFNNIQILGWVVLSQTRPSSIHGVEKPFRLDVMQPFQKLSSWWLGRAPQRSLSQPSFFRGVKLCFRLDVMQTFNNVQMNGWSCSPKHGPAQITLLSQSFVRMAWSSLKTLKT